MKSFFILLSFFFYLNSFAQSSNPFDKYTFDSSYSIVGLGTTRQGSLLYNEQSFYLKDTGSMNALKATWNFTRLNSFYLATSYYEVLILKDKKVIERIPISLEGYAIKVRDNWFYFDKQLLIDLHKNHPFDFHLQDSVFYSEKPAIAYADTLKNKTSCLFAFETFPYPESPHEGAFSMTFDRSDKVADYKVATTIATNKLKKIAQQKEYTAAFPLFSDFNLKYQDKFQIIVNTSKAVYNKLLASGFEKGEWQAKQYKVTSCWTGKGDNSKVASAEVLKPADTYEANEIYKYLNIKAPELLAKYPGGFEAFRKYVYETFEYPEAAIAANVAGEMYATFIVDKSGQVVDVKVIKGLGYGTEEELKRVLLNSRKWYPGKQNGKNIRILYSLPVKVEPATDVQMHSPKDLSSKPDAGRSKYYFENRLNLGLEADFVEEEGRQALSDRFSILNNAVNSFPKDSLANISGKISYQVIIDSTGTCSVVSARNETNRPISSIKIDDILGKSRWNLLPSKKGTRKPVSAILVFTFTDDHIKYQHLTMDPNSGHPVEIEFAKKNKVKMSW